MTVRTFIQHGEGYGSNEVQIRAKINGTVVFEGAVTTINEPVPAELSEIPAPGTEAFSWELDSSFEGTTELVIEVISAGTFVVTNTLANYSRYLPWEDREIFSQIIVNDGISDPFISAQINGVVVERLRNLGTPDAIVGQWWYALASGDILTAQVEILSGIKDPAAPVE